jgi:hypothetical protein
MDWPTMRLLPALAVLGGKPGPSAVASAVFELITRGRVKTRRPLSSMIDGWARSGGQQRIDRKG